VNQDVMAAANTLHREARSFERPDNLRPGHSGQSAHAVTRWTPTYSRDSLCGPSPRSSR
jgi:hypothetical protein